MNINVALSLRFAGASTVAILSVHFAAKNVVIQVPLITTSSIGSA